jgi:ribosome-associated protein
VPKSTTLYVGRRAGALDTAQLLGALEDLALGLDRGRDDQLGLLQLADVHGAHLAHAGADGAHCGRACGSALDGLAVGALRGLGGRLGHTVRPLPHLTCSKTCAVIELTPNVNKVATRIDLRVDFEAIESLSDAARARLRALARRRADAEGRLVVTSQATRNQARNLADARARVADLIRAALVTPRARVKTGPSAGARRRRLAGKKQRAEVKRWRRRPAAAD